MAEPVTVFLVAVACLLVGGAGAGPLAARTGVPEAVWLVGMGALMRVSGMASAETIAVLAPFFGALALIIVLFEAGRDLNFGAGGEVARRARRLTMLGALVAIPTVALFSQALSGLNLLTTWSWTHALMLGALLLCSAPEVFTPALRAGGAESAVLVTLERESALTGALAIAVTAVCIDLLSVRVAEGQAVVAIAAGFGLGLAFGVFAGLLWIAALRRLGPTRGVYPYTLAGLIGLYVVTGALGGIGALAVLVFGAIVANAGVLLAVLFRPRGEVVEGDTQGEDFAAALSDHGRTVEIVRVLLFMFLGLGLGPVGGLLAMGVVLGLILTVLRLLVVRLVCHGVPERDFAAFGAAWPRGMVVAGLAALPHAAGVPGTSGLTTLVFSAVATSCVAFAVALQHQQHQQHQKHQQEQARVPSGMVAAAQPGSRRILERTEIRATGVEEVLAVSHAVVAASESEAARARPSGGEEAVSAGISTGSRPESGLAEEALQGVAEGVAREELDMPAKEIHHELPPEKVAPTLAEWAGLGEGARTEFTTGSRPE